MAVLFLTQTHLLSLYENGSGIWNLRVKDTGDGTVTDFSLEGISQDKGLSLTVEKTDGSDYYKVEEDADIPASHTLFNFRKINSALLDFGIQTNSEFAAVGVADLRECGTVRKDILEYTFWLGPPQNSNDSDKVKYLKVDTLTAISDKGLKVYAECIVDQCQVLEGSCVNVGLPGK